MERQLRDDTGSISTIEQREEWERAPVERAIDGGSSMQDRLPIECLLSGAMVYGRMT